MFYIMLKGNGNCPGEYFRGDVRIPLSWTPQSPLWELLQHCPESWLVGRRLAVTPSSPACWKILHEYVAALV